MKALLLLLLCSSVSAQTLYAYTGIPELTGSIVLSAPLAANLVNQTVVPLSYDFGMLNSQFAQVYPAGNTAQFAFSTDSAGVIDGWNVSMTMNSGGAVSNLSETASITSGGDTFSEIRRGDTLCLGGPGTAPKCAPIHVTSAPGTWADPIQAPEIDPAGAACGLALLLGTLMVARGRCPLRPPPHPHERVD